MPIFCPLSKNTLLSFPYFVKKCHIFKNAVASYIFFQILHEKTPRAVIPIFHIWSKNTILSKLLYIMGQKSQKDAFHGGKDGE